MRPRRACGQGPHAATALIGGPVRGMGGGCPSRPPRKMLYYLSPAWLRIDRTSDGADAPRDLS